MLTYTNDGIAISVGFDRYDGDRVGYTWRIVGSSILPSTIARAPEGQVYVENVLLAEGDDLRSGSGDEISLPKMLVTLVNFLSAWAEARDESSENWTLFPASLREAVLPKDWQNWCDNALLDLDTQEG